MPEQSETLYWQLLEVAPEEVGHYDISRSVRTLPGAL